MNRVAVLMSTYNGRSFLQQQIDSVLAQKDVELTLFIRDDGSSDGTYEMLEFVSENNSCVRLISGSNVGVGRSFMETLYSAGDGFDYYAFCDQDDIWLCDKLARGIEMITAHAGPCCYCSNQSLIDTDGNPLGERYEESIDTGYMQVLCNNRVTGCTMIWNNALQLLLLDTDRHPSDDLLMRRIHDVWVAMVAASTGVIIYDNNSYIQYRQHDNNVVGAGEESKIKLWKKKLFNKNLRNGRSILANEIVSKYADVIKDSSITRRLSGYAGYRESLKTKNALLRDKVISKYSGESRFMLSIKILLGLF